MSIKRYCSHILYRILPLDLYMKIVYKHYFKERLDLDNPQKFSEKLWWLKKYYGIHNNGMISTLYDKYTVREYVSQKVGKQYLNTLYQVYKNPKDIDINELPQSFALKLTQSCGCNLLCKDKSKVTNDEVVLEASRWMSEYRNSVLLSNEDSFHFNGSPSIICEKLLLDRNNQYPDDYKIYCINGKVQFTRVCVDTINDDGSRKKHFVMNTYDPNWNLMNLYTSQEHYRDESIDVPKPKNYDEMIFVAEQLAKDFPFVRVDLYNIDGKIYFGELTWFPGGCTEKLRPMENELKYGKMMVLPEGE